MTDLDHVEGVQDATGTTPARRLEGLISPDRGASTDERVKRGLAEMIEEVLWDSLSWRRALNEECYDQELLFQAYAKSVVELDHARKEAVHFFQQVGKANREFRTEGPVNVEARDRALQAEAERFDQLIAWPPQPADKVFNVQLTNVGIDSIITVLGRELKARTSGIVSQFLALCVELVRKEVLGVVEWANPTACELFFFKRILIQREEGRRIVAGQQTTEQIRGGLRIVTSRSEVIEGEHEIRKARHEHHLHQAKEVSLAECGSVIPQQYQALLQAIPCWLRPLMRLVTGIQFRGRVLEIEVGKEAWQGSKEISPVEEYRYVLDPVVVLGPIVFSGWDDNDMESENQRMDAEAMKSEQNEITALNVRMLHRAWALAALWQMIALVLVGAGNVHGCSWLWTGVGLAGLGVIVMLLLARFHAAVHAKGIGPKQYLAVLVASIGTILSLHMIGVGIIHDWLGCVVLGLVSLVISIRGSIWVAKAISA